MSPDSETPRTECLHFSGRVQGVGFRYTARSIASRLPIMGYVRNLPDGRVELVAQGRRDAIDELIRRLAAHFGDGIARIDRSELDEAGAMSGFEIRY